MSATPLDDLVKAVYPQIFSKYSLPSPAEQLEQSLRRQREQGVPFSVAWTRALGKLAHDWHGDERHAWEEVIADPGFRLVWEAAYHHRPLPALGAFDVLRRSLEAEAADARRRQSDLSSQPPRAVA